MNTEPQYERSTHDERPACADDPAATAQLLDTLLTHYLNQNDLMWSRAEALIAVQGAVLGASYYLWQNSSLGWARVLLIAGAILTALIAVLAIEDKQDRDGNAAEVQRLATILGAQIRLTNRPQWLRWADGDSILFTVLLLFVLLDIALCVVWH